MDRRTLLQGLVAIAPGACVMTTPARAANPDVKLIAICAELRALDAACDELGDRPLDEPGVDARIAESDARYQALLAEAAQLRAVTLEGVRARLSVFPSVVDDLRSLAAIREDEEAQFVRVLADELEGEQA